MSRRRQAAAELKQSAPTPTPPQKKTKLFSEKVLPLKLESYVPESALYTHLLQFEQKVDAMLAKKQMAIAEAIQTPVMVKEVLRIFVYNEYHGQDTTDPEYNPDLASWTLKVQGHLVDPQTGAPSNNTTPMTHFLSKVIVQLDPTKYPANQGMIEWRKSTTSALTDGFEIKRLGLQDVSCRILLHLSHSPPLYQLSPLLSSLLQIFVDNKRNILTALWTYIKSHGLHRADDPNVIHCDQPLAKLFGAESVTISSLLARLQLHLSPPDPYVIDYTIKVTGDPRKEVNCFDIPVSVPASISASLAHSIQRLPEMQRDVAHYQTKIEHQLASVRHHHRRRQFLLAFAQQPLEASHALIAAQARDTQIVDGVKKDVEEELHADYYQNRPWIADAVDRYLNEQGSS